MYVRNVAGYNFSFYYRGKVMYIPFDGKIYSIPDDSGRYRELKTILPMHVRTQEVVYLNTEGKITDGGKKRRGRKPGKKVGPYNKKDDDLVDKSIISLDINELINDDENLKLTPPIENTEDIDNEKPKKRKYTKKKTSTKKKNTTKSKKKKD